MSDIKKYLAEIGAKGGSAGTGAAKRRPAEHYARMVEARKKNKRPADSPAARDSKRGPAD